MEKKEDKILISILQILILGMRRLLNFVEDHLRILKKWMKLLLKIGMKL